MSPSPRYMVMANINFYSPVSICFIVDRASTNLFGNHKVVKSGLTVADANKLCEEMNEGENNELPRL